jgi:hypothetical protein
MLHQKMAIPTKKNTKIIIIVLVLTLYGTCVALLGGKLPNQTAALATVQGSEIQSLIPRQNLNYANLSLESTAWNVSGQNVTSSFEQGRLTFLGTYMNLVSPLFLATQTGLELNFTERPFLRLVVSTTPTTEMSFYLGSLNSSIAYDDPPFIEKDQNTFWVNISYLQGSEEIDGPSVITINLSQRLEQLGLDNQEFTGLQIVGKRAIEPISFDKDYNTTIYSLSLLNEPPYAIALTEGRGQNLPDGSAAHVIRRDSIIDNSEDCPYLQRAYILYSMNGSKGALYNIFLLSKHDNSLTAVKSGFVFVHDALLDEVSTYVDWRKPIQLDYAFEPIASLFVVMRDGDYAVVFAPLKDNELQEVEVHQMQFTFSKLPYSAFVIINIGEDVLIITSIFILTIAGTLPTALMLCLFYLYRKDRLGTDKGTIKKILIIGIALRLILAFITAYADDTQIFAELGALYFGSGVFGAQWVSLPGFTYLETAAYFPYALFRAVGFRDFQFLALDIYSVEAFFTKIPAILSDLGSFFFILKIADKYAPKKKVLLSGLYLLNPLTVYISSILGQFDSIFTFTLIASIYYLVAEYNSFKATIFSSFAAILNPVGIATFIPLTVNAYLRKRPKDMIKSLLLAISIFGISMLPFLFETNSPVLLASHERLLGAIPGESFYGLKREFYAYGTHISSSVGYGLTFRFLLEMAGFELGSIFFPYGAAFVFLIFVGIFIYKTREAYAKGAHGLIYTGTFMLIVASLFQVTFPTIFDQFVVWVAGLLIISYILSQNRKFLLIFTTISISTGFIYVSAWRNYLHLISGVETVLFGNLFVAAFTSALIGTLYSLILVAIIVITLKMWMQKKTPSKIEEMPNIAVNDKDEPKNEGSDTEQA